MNADKLLFRAHTTSRLMGKMGLTEKQEIKLDGLEEKKPLTKLQEHEYNDLLEKRYNPSLPRGCITELNRVYRELTWSRKNKYSNKYLRKGLMCEQEGIDLYSQVKVDFFSKNTLRLENEFLTGEVDLFKGKGIRSAEETIDIKISWDWTTFPYPDDAIETGYEYQGHSYMDLTGAKKHTIAHCLVNTPPVLIMDSKKRLAWEMMIGDEETEEYIEQCREIEKNSIYDLSLFRDQNPYFEFHSNLNEWTFDIPSEQRVVESSFERNTVVIQEIHERIIFCRDYMNKNLFKVPELILA